MIDSSVYFFTFSGVCFGIYLIYSTVQAYKRYVRKQAVVKYLALGPKRKIVTDRSKVLPLLSPSSTKLPSSNSPANIKSHSTPGKFGNMPLSSQSRLSNGLRQRAPLPSSPLDRMRLNRNRPEMSTLRPSKVHAPSALRHSSIPLEHSSRMPEATSYEPQITDYSQNGFEANEANSLATPSRVLTDYDTNQTELIDTEMQSELGTIKSRKRLFLKEEESDVHASTPIKSSLKESAKKRKLIVASEAKNSKSAVKASSKTIAVQADFQTPKSAKRKAQFSIDVHDDDISYLKPEDGWITPASRRQGKRAKMTPFPDSRRRKSIELDEKTSTITSTPLAKSKNAQSHGRIKLTPSVKSSSLKSLVVSQANVRPLLDDDTADELTIQLLKAAAPSIKPPPPKSEPKPTLSSPGAAKLPSTTKPFELATLTTKTDVADTITNKEPSEPDISKPLLSIPTSTQGATVPAFSFGVSTPATLAASSSTVDAKKDSSATPAPPAFSFSAPSDKKSETVQPASALPTSTVEKVVESKPPVSAASSLLVPGFKPPAATDTGTSSATAFKFGPPSSTSTTAPSFSFAAPVSSAKKDESVVNNLPTTSTTTASGLAFKAPSTASTLTHPPLFGATATVQSKPDEGDAKPKDGPKSVSQPSQPTSFGTFQFGTPAQTSTSAPAVTSFQAPFSTSSTPSLFTAPKEEDKKPITTPSSSAGFGSAIGKPSNLFGTTSQPQAAPAPSALAPASSLAPVASSLFSFGAQSQPAASAPSTTSKPNIPSFGTSASSSTSVAPLGAAIVTAPTLPAPSTSTPAPFSFGASAATSAPTTGGTFAFGSTAPSVTSQSSSSTFSFGGSTPATTVVKPAPTPAPAFQFGASSTSATSSSTIGFGASTSAPSFGTAASTTPTFGATTGPFGGSTTSAPAFGSAQPTSSSPFQFGGSTNMQQSQSSMNPSPFGSHPVNPAPSFQFGGSQPQASPSMSMPGPMGAPPPSSTAFQFGASAPQQGGNTFQFGGSNTSQPAAGTFSFGAGGATMPTLGAMPTVNVPGRKLAQPKGRLRKGRGR